MSRDIEKVYADTVKSINSKYTIGSDKWSHKLERLGNLED